MSMRLAAVVASSLALATPAASLALAAYWPLAKVMRSIDGVRVRVGHHVVRIDSETTLCSGEGRRIRRRGVRMWSRFACTFTTFTPSGVDRDLEFDVYVTGPRRYVIRNARWIGLSR
jgi:hypothetical protein